MSFYQAVMVAQAVMATSGWLLDGIIWSGEVPQPHGEQLFEVVAYHGSEKYYIRTQEQWDELRVEHALERKKK